MKVYKGGKMKVKILKVTDKKGNPKNQRIWNDERILVIIKNMKLIYTDGSLRVRETTDVKNITIVNDKIKVETKNSIYELQVINIIE